MFRADSRTRATGVVAPSVTCDIEDGSSQPIGPPAGVPLDAKRCVEPALMTAQPGPVLRSPLRKARKYWHAVVTHRIRLPTALWALILICKRHG